MCKDVQEMLKNQKQQIAKPVYSLEGLHQTLDGNLGEPVRGIESLATCFLLNSDSASLGLDGPETLLLRSCHVSWQCWCRKGLKRGGECGEST